LADPHAAADDDGPPPKAPEPGPAPDPGYDLEPGQAASIPEGRAARHAARARAAAVGPHLWDIRWVRDLAFLLAGLLLLWVMWVARGVVIPVLVGTGFAYVFRPLVNIAERRYRWRRWATASLILVVLLLLLLALLASLAPLAIEQGAALGRRLPDYVRTAWSAAQNWVEARQPGAESGDVGAAPASPGGGEAPADDPLAALVPEAMAVLRWAVGAVGGILGFAAYFSVAIVIVAFTFVFYSWHLPGLVRWLQSFIPRSIRAEVVDLAGEMDRAVTSFIRGRLIQSLMMAIVLSVGFLIVDVPYWLLLGIAGGLLNLIPFAASISWIAAVTLAIVEFTTDQPDASILAYWAPLLLPTLVYAVAQGLDGWVIEPLVQGSATNLDPVAVFLAVLIGGAIAGFLGMLLAIPVAACLKILARRAVLPRLRRFAATH